MHSLVTVLVFVAMLCGCATTGSDNPVKIEGNAYKLGGAGKAMDTSGTVVRIRLLQQATTFCASKGLAMAPGKSSSKAPSAGARATAEIQFRCVPK